MGRRTAEPGHRFGVAPPLTIGVEEELLLVDRERRLIPDAERVIEALDAAASTELADLRSAVRATGVGLLGAGIHPDDGGEARLVPKPRHHVVKEDLGGLLSTPPSGLRGRAAGARGSASPRRRPRRRRRPGRDRADPRRGQRRRPPAAAFERGGIPAVLDYLADATAADRPG